MRVLHCNGNNILNSTFRNSGHSGLLIHQSHLNNIQGCKAYNYFVGISQYGSSDNTIQWCPMYENDAEGLTIDVGSHNSRVHHNWIHKNNLPRRGVGGIGIDASKRGLDLQQHHRLQRPGRHQVPNNVCCGCDGVRIYDNENISYNQRCAVRIRRTQPVTNLGFLGNRSVGNSASNGICYE